MAKVELAESNGAAFLATFCNMVLLFVMVVCMATYGQ